ncbi:DMT family transporter [Methylobacterium nigriterrae]|uniref:DMT family transporter n=1 Tax=Methylobacterium nigriterrae TaxID=3127512 RepID=UPI003013DFF1
MLAWLLIPFAALAGALTTLQAGSNAALKKSLGEPLPALLINYGLGIVVLANRITRQSWLGFGKLSGVPWWAWVGGLAAIVLAYRLGAATLMASIVTGQVIASVLLDHFGWLGFEVHAANVWRLLGAALMIIGVALVARF